MTDSRISRDLRNRIFDFRQTGENTYSFQIIFELDFEGFAGHFPENPIVPGVCLLSLARVQAENVLKKQTMVKRVLQCKFRRPFLAEQKAACILNMKKQDNEDYMIQCDFQTENESACRIRMEISEVLS